MRDGEVKVGEMKSYLNATGAGSAILEQYIQSNFQITKGFRNTLCTLAPTSMAQSQNKIPRHFAW